jgi:hypothetical protein
LVPRDRRVVAIPGTVLHRRSNIALLRHPARLPPRTRIEETTIDLALGAGTLDEALGWLARACGSRLTTSAQLTDALAGRQRARWRRELATALADISSGTHSLLELRYLREVERPHGLPRGQRPARMRDGTLRYGWAGITDRPCRVAVQVAAVLRRRGWAGAARPCGPACPVGRR